MRGAAAVLGLLGAAWGAVRLAAEDLTEETARAALGGDGMDVKSIDQADVQTVIERQWWKLAQEIVAKSHEAKVDLSSPVRSAVREIKSKADTLLRSLDPLAGKPKPVSPAFQWAQNSTHLIMSVKFTARWNAPGALEAKDVKVNFTDSTFNFEGIGEHSNNKYTYTLNLDFFDRIVAEGCRWKAASVGKLDVTVQKKWARKWPRLLRNKKKKISNMHFWMELQDKLESTLANLGTASNSPFTCQDKGKVYCLPSDSCKAADDCASCAGKTTLNQESFQCVGLPTERGTVTFKDADMQPGTVGGTIKVSKAKVEHDVSHYAVYWGTAEKKLDSVDRIADLPVTGQDIEWSLDKKTLIPEGATHFVVHTRNDLGEHETGNSAPVVDGVWPSGKATGLSFDDRDGEQGEVSGTVTIQKAEDESRVTHYVLSWGKSKGAKVGKDAHISDVPVTGNAVTHYISVNTKPPKGAQYILAFSKNEHGELPEPVAIPLKDRVKPSGTVAKVTLQGGDITTGSLVLDRSMPLGKEGGDVKDYAVYWSTSVSGDCAVAQRKGYIGTLSESNQYTMAMATQPRAPEEAKTVVVYARNDLGESSTCTSMPFDKPPTKPKEGEL